MNKLYNNQIGVRMKSELEKAKEVYCQTCETIMEVVDKVEYVDNPLFIFECPKCLPKPRK